MVEFGRLRFSAPEVLDAAAGSLLTLSAVVACVEKAFSAHEARARDAVTWTIAGIDARLYAARHSGLVNLDATCIGSQQSLRSWQVLLSDQQGSTVAHAVVTQVRSDSARGEERVRVTTEGDKPAAGRRSASFGERRDRIAEAACAVIAKKGFTNATIREIADAAGLHVPTLYQYVASKEDLLELVYTWTMDRVQVDVARAAEVAETSEGKLASIARAMLRSAVQNRAQIGVLNRELRSLPPPARLRVLTRYGSLMGEIATVIEAGVARGELRPVDPRVAANAVDALCDMPALRSFAFNGMSSQEVQAQIIEIICAGLSLRSA